MMVTTGVNCYVHACDVHVDIAAEGEGSIPGVSHEDGDAPFDAKLRGTDAGSVKCAGVTGDSVRVEGEVRPTGSLTLSRWLAAFPVMRWISLQAGRPFLGDAASVEDEDDLLKRTLTPQNGRCIPGGEGCPPRTKPAWILPSRVVLGLNSG